MRYIARFIVPLMLASATGCTEYVDNGSGNPAPTPPPAPSVSIAPAQSIPPATEGPTVIQLDRVTVNLPTGSLGPEATILASSAQAVGAVPGFSVAGPGVHLDIQGGQLALPAMVQFDVGAAPAPGLEPATLHLGDDQKWDLVPAQSNGNGIQLTTTEFSSHIPGWLDPASAAAALLGGAVNLAGLRTSTPECRSAPTWPQITSAALSTVHVCVSTNPDGVPELVVKSNRSYWMQVTVPQPHQWVWVSNMPGWMHQVVFGPDTNRYLLPPGETMTVGLAQPSGAPMDMSVHVERNTLTYGLSFLTLITGEMENWIADVYALVKCGLSARVMEGDAASTARTAFECVGTIFDGLDDADTAAAAAREVLGEQSLSDPDLAPAFDRLARRFEGFGRFLAAIGAGVTLLGAVDMLADEISSDNMGTVIGLHLDAIVPSPATAPTTPSAATVVPPPTTPPPPPATSALGVVFTEQPFLCDGSLHPFGSITGAQPGEFITFYSPEVPNLVNGSANSNGELTMQWQCEPHEVGMNWSLTATGATSGRTITLLIHGA